MSENFSSDYIWFIADLELKHRLYFSSQGYCKVFINELQVWQGLNVFTISRTKYKCLIGTSCTRAFSSVLNRADFKCYNRTIEFLQPLKDSHETKRIIKIRDHQHLPFRLVTGFDNERTLFLQHKVILSSVSVFPDYVKGDIYSSAYISLCVFDFTWTYEKETIEFKKPENNLFISGF